VLLPGLLAMARNMLASMFLSCPCLCLFLDLRSSASEAYKLLVQLLLVLLLACCLCALSQQAVTLLIQHCPLLCLLALHCELLLCWCCCCHW
jgi:hypothetical protein